MTKKGSSGSTSDLSSQAPLMQVCGQESSSNCQQGSGALALCKMEHTF